MAARGGTVAAIVKRAAGAPEKPAVANGITGMAVAGRDQGCNGVRGCKKKQSRGNRDCLMRDN
jgi:hypothetical protein